MKTYLLPLAVAAGLLAGCNRSIESASQDFNALPPSVQKAVRSQAPNAEIAHIDSKTENGQQVYEIEFREPGQNPTMVVSADGTIVSGNGTSKTEGVVGTVEKALTPTGAVGTQFSALPEKVQHAIQEHAPDAQISDISRSTDNGRVIYSVEFKSPGENPTMRIAEDGTIVQDVQK